MRENRYECSPPSSSRLPDAGVLLGDVEVDLVEEGRSQTWLLNRETSSLYPPPRGCAHAKAPYALAYATAASVSIA
jgi:hypothetical protein